MKGNGLAPVPFFAVNSEITPIKGRMPGNLYYLAFIMKKLFKSNVKSLYSFVVYEFSIRDEFDKRMLCKLSFGE